TSTATSLKHDAPRKTGAQWAPVLVSVWSGFGLGLASDEPRSLLVVRLDQHHGRRGRVSRNVVRHRPEDRSLEAGTSVRRDHHDVHAEFFHGPHDLVARASLTDHDLGLDAGGGQLSLR